ncbi:MAG: 6-phospho-beta-glucosidase [Acidobacteriota bacterium]|nr:6-phospho-beta-glucosidase [Acidobacteriota bacterium]
MNGVKVTLIGGGGARTPLLLHGLAQAQSVLNVREVALYDVSRPAAELMASVGREIVRNNRADFELKTPDTLEGAIEGAHFVLSSIRVGGIEARARDERLIIDQGLVGQETTGPGGLAMALRTVPIALAHAHLIERLAPEAWLINFTNPAGLITQALMTHSTVRVIGICDTPSELFHRIAWSLGLPFEDLEFVYSGLNHLGWVQRVLLRGEDITTRLLNDDEALLRLYPARLFEPEMIRTLGLIPSEYLFYYYAKTRAFRNQRTAGASRGEEIRSLNTDLFQRMRSDPAEALTIYKNYLNQRNASYMRLEAHAESARDQGPQDWNPFEAATGYHRIALDVMTALSGDTSRRVVVNVHNHGAIEDLHPFDVVEVPCLINRHGPEPVQTGGLPESVKGLVWAVKGYEHLAIRAAVERSFDLARLALMVYPTVGEWSTATDVMRALVDCDPDNLGYLT